MTHTPAASKQPIPESITRLRMPLAAGGLVLLVVAALLGISSLGMSYFLHAYLTGFAFCLTISIGALFLINLQHLCRAGWSVTTRRIMELLMINIRTMAVLFVPILVAVFVSKGALYDWQNAEYLEHHHLPQVKLDYLLNSGGYAIGSVICFLVWGVVANFFWSNSRLQDETHDARLTEKMQKWSGPCLMGVALVTSAAAFLWIMSLRPAWFSTMFGVYLFAGSMLSLFATLNVLVFIIQRAGGLKEVTVEHWHDLGKFTFGFTFFWAYIAFSQYMLIWYGNIPEETVWFLTRQTNGWAAPSIALIFVQWLIPFLGTMSRHVRRRPALMCFWGVWLLAAHYLDLFWLIMPETGGVVTEALVDPLGGGMGIVVCLLTVFGMLGIYLGGALWRGVDVPALPIGDPRLPESLAFENA